MIGPTDSRATDPRRLEADAAGEPWTLAQDAGAARRLRRSVAGEVVGVDLASAFAGDRELTRADEDLIRRQTKARDGLFFSDLLYAVCHQHVAPELAEALWTEILSHKDRVSECLGRNVGIVVAALDYLSNVTRSLQEATLISEADVSEITRQAMRDGMTGLFNRSTCYELLDLEIRNRRRHGIGVGLLLLDIDDFKSVNETEGYLAGDRMLAELAGMLVEVARDTDICCRLGGDEFVVILCPIHDSGEALMVAERVRANCEGIGCKGRRMAVSIGGALCDDAVTSPQALIEEADRALRRAKTEGKNRVMLAKRDHGPCPGAGGASSYR